MLPICILRIIELFGNLANRKCVHLILGFDLIVLIRPLVSNVGTKPSIVLVQGVYNFFYSETALREVHSARVLHLAEKLHLQQI